MESVSRKPHCREFLDICKAAELPGVERQDGGPEGPAFVPDSRCTLRNEPLGGFIVVPTQVTGPAGQASSYPLGHLAGSKILTFTFF